MSEGRAKYAAMKLYIPSVFLVLIISWSGISAQEKVSDEKRRDFRGIWEMIRKNSPSQKAAVEEEMAAEIQKNRQGRHWLPRVYADFRGYATNDPGMTLMSNMGERSVRAEDFIPNSLNNPGTSMYRKGTLGIDLPLYEGGAGVEMTRALEKIAEARKLQRKLVHLYEYSTTASVYGRVIVSMKSLQDMKDLEANVSRILANYQGGLRSNPVEYSGILGLMALQNRLKAMIGEKEAQAAALKGYLEKMSGDLLPQGWIPGDDNALAFSESNLRALVAAGPAGSLNSRAFEALADSARNRAEAEKAVFLPRIGLFSEASLTNGSRDTGDSYTAGFYVRMNLLSPTDYGAMRQAKLQSDAARSRAREARLKESIDLSRLLKMSDTLKKNIVILKESDSLMDEQIRNSLNLYARGSIRSFQIADIFARKADLLSSLAGAQEEYINALAGIYNYTVSDDKEVKNGR